MSRRPPPDPSPATSPNSDATCRLADVRWQDGRTYAIRQSRREPFTLFRCRIISGLPMLAPMDHAAAAEPSLTEFTFALSFFSGPVECHSGRTGRTVTIPCCSEPRRRPAPRPTGCCHCARTA